jgi:hypothetical protein
MRAGVPGIRAAPFIGLTAVEGRSLSLANLGATPVRVNELRRRTQRPRSSCQSRWLGLNAAKHIRWWPVSIFDSMLR